MTDQKYRVSIGVSVVKAESPGFANHGTTYFNLDEEQITVIQQLAEKHKAEITAGMTGLYADLVALGYEQAGAARSKVKG